MWAWPVIVWALGLLILSVGLWPWTTRIFRSIPDRGAGLAIPSALFAAFFVLRICWLLFPFQPHPAWCLLICLGLSMLGWALHPPFNGSFGTAARMRSAAIRAVGLFFVLFFFWVRIRAADPGISHTEQPMDFMWMNAAAASQGPIVRDAWFGGEPATYYTDGHQFLAFLTLLFGQPLSIGVNLSQATLFAMTGLLAAEAARLWTGSRVAGRIAALLLLGVSSPLGSWDALSGGNQGWWWWRATRVLKDGPTELITEFPFFSFWLGDNHAHVIGLPFLLLGVVGALVIQRSRWLTLYTLLPAGLALAWAWRINPWQTPTVLALTLLGGVARKKLPSKSELLPAAAGFLLGLIPLLSPGAGGMFQGVSIGIQGWTDPLEFLQVFGFLVPGLLLALFPGKDWFRWGVLLLCLGMFTMCNLVRVNDLFHSRMNTVFKVYYQLWVLFSLLAAIGWATAMQSTDWRRWLSRFSLILPVLGLAYAARLSGAAFAEKDLSLDARTQLPQATRDLVDHALQVIQPGDRIAEAPGDSYQPTHSLLGTWTAGDSLIGWTGHQQQWRPGVSHPDPRLLYTAPTEGDLIMAAWDLKIDWVFVGPREQELYRPSPQWQRWMDHQFNRVVETPYGILWGPKGHEYLKTR